MSWLNLLLAPIETPTDTGGTHKEDVIKMFGDEDDTDTETLELPGEKRTDKTDGKEKEGEETDDKEKDGEVKDEDDEDKETEEELDDELKDLEDEIKEPTEEELELVTPVRRREILAKYPKLFKEFPYLESAYYRERKFTEIFPTIAEAESAVKKGRALDTFESELRSGNTENVLKLVKDSNSNAFAKIVDDYLPTLAKVDEKAFYHVLGGVIKDTIISMVRESKNSKDDELAKAAERLNHFVFGTKEFVPQEPMAKEEKEDSSEKKLQNREQEIVREKFVATRDGLNSKVENVLKKTIAGNIDPRDSMTEYIKKNASREALESVTAMIERDTRFKSLLDRLWEKTIKGNFQQVDVDRIKSAYLSKAKTLLPTVLKKARTDALKGMGKRVREEKEETPEPEETNPPERKKEGRTTPSSNRGLESDRERAKKIPAHVSTRDYLMQD